MLHALVSLLSSLSVGLGRLMSLLSGVRGFLGGALVGTLISLLAGGIRARRERRIVALQEQLRLLYGPVAALASQNEQCFRFVAKIQTAHSKHFAHPEVTENEMRRQALVTASERTTNLENQYVMRVIKNNARIMKIIDANWHLVDDVDRDIFSQFQFEYIRHLVEYKRGGIKEVPMSVLLDIGPEVAFMRPQMMSGVSKAFQSKRENLEKERKRWW